MPLSNGFIKLNVAVDTKRMFLDLAKHIAGVQESHYLQVSGKRFAELARPYDRQAAEIADRIQKSQEELAKLNFELKAHLKTRIGG